MRTGREKNNFAVNEEINHGVEDSAMQTDPLTNRVEDPVNEDRDGDIEGTFKVKKKKIWWKAKEER